MIRLSRKQILGLLIFCGAVILHAPMWPYNFLFDWGTYPSYASLYVILRPAVAWLSPDSSSPLIAHRDL